MGRLRILLATLIASCASMAPAYADGVAYRVGKGIQFSGATSVPSSAPSRGLLWVGSGDGLLHYTNPSSSDVTLVGVSGSIATGQVAYATSANILGGASTFVYAPASGIGLTGSGSQIYGDATNGLTLVNQNVGGTYLFLSSIIEASTRLKVDSSGIQLGGDAVAPCAGCIHYASGTSTMQFSNDGLSWINIPTSGGGGSTGNYTFSSNAMTLTGAAAMTIGATTATSITLGASGIGTTLSGTATFAHGALASGSTSFDLSGSTGTFKTPTGAATFGGSSNAFSGPITQTTTSIGTAQTSGFTLTNTTAATSSVQQYSPGIVLNGNAWNTTSSASQVAGWSMQTSTVQGTTVNSNLDFYQNINGTSTKQLSFTQSAGGVTIVQGATAFMGVLNSALVGIYAQSNTLYLAGGAGTIFYDGNALWPASGVAQSVGRLTNEFTGVYNAGTSSCGFSAQSVTTYSASATADCQIGLTNTAARTVTLPAASTVVVGQYIELMDEAGTAGTANISVARTGSDTINGGTSTLAVVKTNTKSSKCTAVSSSAYFCTVN